MAASGALHSAINNEYKSFCRGLSWQMRVSEFGAAKMQCDRERRDAQHRCKKKNGKRL